jgi:putative effector of murein hydrolase LrgA (UPF0299 family)
MTAIINGLIWLFAALWLGNVLQELWLHSIPGPVLGMVLLLTVLLLTNWQPVGLNDVALWFIKYLSFFFIPAAVGIWFLDSAVQQQWPAIVMATVPATILTQLLVALLLKFLLARTEVTTR